MKISNIVKHGSRAGVPTAYRVDQILLTNCSGDSHDIQAFVTDFTITESIYTPSLILSLNVKDPINLFEEMKLSGQETISIQLAKTPLGSSNEDTVSLNFIVTEYPVYGRFPNRLHAYTLKGVSPHAFLSKLLRVSKAFSGTLRDFSSQILLSTLRYDASRLFIDSKNTASVSLVVPNLTPLDAVVWALRRAYDASGAPWYCYETLHDGMRLEAQSSMVQKSAYQTYSEGRLFTYDPYTVNDYNQRATRILSAASTLNMSKYVTAPAGAWAGRATYCDSATKTISVSTFDYLSKFGSMVWTPAGNPNLAPEFQPSGESLNDYLDAAQQFVPINSLAFGQTDRNYHSTTGNGNILTAQSYVENLDNMICDVTLAGDFQLSAGKTAILQLQKTIDPNIKVQDAQNSTSDRWDESLSGIYLVTTVIHSFGSEYTCQARMKKDTSGIVL
jgi:hypothetical protein